MMVRKQQSKGGERVFVYEAGPCGFWIYREITALGERCMVVSPALVPKRAGDHVKTDRRDSERLASLARAGELEAIHVPDIRDEAIRDLVRGRDDAVIAQRRVRQQLKALLLRNDIRYVGRTSWTGAHRRMPSLCWPSSEISPALARLDSSWVIWAWSRGRTPRGSTGTRVRSPKRATATRGAR
jgi:transposase